MSKKTDFSKLRDSFLYAPMHTDFGANISRGEWAEPIEQLLAAGYAFIGSGFTADGFLYRGISQNLLHCISNGKFGHFPGSNEMTRVEQIMDIFFVSHEISDAISVSSLYQKHSDHAILVFNASLFNQQLLLKQAAVLAIGDFGLVFRYPFLTHPLKLAEVAYIISNTETANIASGLAITPITEKLICIDPCGRSDCAKQIDEQFERRGIKSAQPVNCRLFPRRCGG